MLEEATPEVKEDFRKFLYHTWAFLGLPKPTPIQYDIAEYLQNGPRRFIIEAFRGVGKSWITSAFVIWVLLNDPSKKVLVVSASKDRADNFSTFTKRLIREMPMLRHLRPNPDKGHRDSNVAFDVGPCVPDHAPSVKSVGITGQLAGSRADLIVGDDIEVPNNSLTQLMRDRLAEAVKEFDAIIKPNGRIIYLGTPQSEMSVYSVIAERGYDVQVWPARYPKADTPLNGLLAPFLQKKLDENPQLRESKHTDQYGQPTDPNRFDELDLQERALSYGKSGFALQFMLDTTISDEDRYPLKLRDLMVMGTSPRRAPLSVEWGSGPNQKREDIPVVGLAGDRLFRPAFQHESFDEYQGAVLFIDPAGRGADETGYAVIKFLNGILYLRKFGGLKGGYDEAVLTKLAKMCRDEEINYLRIESNFGDGMFTSLFRPYLRKYWYDLFDDEETDVRHNQQKEARIIDTLEPVMAQHRLVVDEDQLKLDAQVEDPKMSFMYQLTRITRDRGALAHDDRLDAVAGAAAFWVEKMAKDSQEMVSSYYERQKEEQLREFVERTRGRTTPNNWTGAAYR